MTRGRWATAVVTMALFLVTLTPDANARDPQVMTKAEWSAVHEGMKRSYVEGVVCGCLGSLQISWTSNEGYAMRTYIYQTPVGTAEINYRKTAAGLKAYTIKLWCPRGQNGCDVAAL